MVDREQVLQGWPGTRQGQSGQWQREQEGPGEGVDRLWGKRNFVGAGRAARERKYRIPPILSISLR